MTETAREQGQVVGGRSRRVATWLAWAVLGLYGVSLGFVVILYVLNRSYERALAGDIAHAVAYTALAVVGFLIAAHRPGNAIGWLFGAIALSAALTFLAEQYGQYALMTNPDSLPGGLIAAWTSSWSWVPAVVLPGTFLLLLFPDGRLLSPRWSPVAWLAGCAMAMLILFAAFRANPLDGVFSSYANPAGIEGLRGIDGLVADILDLLLVGVLLASAGSVIVRFRRSRGEERQQMKWFAYAAAMMVVLFGFNGLFAGPGNLFFGLSVTLLPIATGIAILKYRLYDIDLLINRTLVYGVLTALLAALYFGGVATIQSLFRALTGQEQQPQLAIVVSTLAIAALFNPLRRRVQAFVDRRFYRRKYDAAKTLEAFGARLRDETDLEHLGGDLVAVVRETVQPEHASLWLRPSHESQEGRVR
jgi:hypothetical protein